MSRATRTKIINKMKTVGVAARIKDGLRRHLFYLLDKIREEQDDDKTRHFVLLIFTDEGVDVERDSIAVSTDLITSLDGEDAVEFVGDWLLNIVKQSHH